MRVFNFTNPVNGHQPASIVETGELPESLPPVGTGFVWIACARREFEVLQESLQASLLKLCGTPLVDLHVLDLLNNQLPSHYDYTSQYDILVFRRLASGVSETDLTRPGEPLHVQSSQTRRGGPPVLRRIDTSPVGFAVFDGLLLTVHPTDCAVRDAYAARLLSMQTQPLEARTAGGIKLPSSPADLMLRIVNHMVDGYLDLRRKLSQQLDHWQSELLLPGGRFTNWSAVLDARMTLHYLDEVCEDQRAAVQDWIDSLETWADAETATGRREQELLKVRSRDVLEHIARVVQHVRRLEQSAETAVQMHFSAQSHRTNDVMRTLTALTAIFLPLNLITGFFGMNFEHLPLIKTAAGFWSIFFLMVLVVVGVVMLFWRKQYLARSSR